MNAHLARLLIVMVLAVQYGLVEHSFEHVTPYLDAGCEVCVAGAHPAPLPATVAPLADPAASPLRPASAQVPAPSRRHRTASLPRAPPAIA